MILVCAGLWGANLSLHNGDNETAKMEMEAALLESAAVHLPRLFSDLAGQSVQ
jgi:hypothetical protein